MASLFFLYFLLFLLPLYPVHTYPQCPSFFCGSLGEVGFPFINTAGSGGDCGSIILNCSDEMAPKVQFHDQGKWYLVKKFHYFRKIIIITDSELQSHLEFNHCESLSNITDVPVASSSFTYSFKTPSFPFFKCKKKAQIPHDLFPPETRAKKFKGCTDDYELYFPEEDNSILPCLHGSLSNICSTFQLPKPLSWDTNETVLEDEDPIEVASGWNPRNESITNLTSLWGATYILEWVIQPHCAQCLLQGGSCPEHQNGTFQCGSFKETGKDNKGKDNKGKDDKGMKIAIGIGTGLGGILLACSVLFICQRCKKVHSTSPTNMSWSSSSQQSLKQDIERGGMSLPAPIFTYDELEEATNNFHPSQELGDGGFGTVYRGRLRDGRVVAVKRLYKNNYKRVEKFMNEVTILSHLRHPNLVALYGCTSRHSRELLLVYEFVPNGTVGDHLHGDRANAGLLTWPIRMTIAIETAEALTYLHASDIIHRDVKTNNILLDNHFHVKVADFGLSRLFPSDVTHVSTAPQGTPGYVDPEYYQCYQLNDRSDVYSFGVVLIELISSKPAVDISRLRHEINLASMAMNKILNNALHELVDPSLGFESDYGVRRMVTLVAELAFRCLQHDRELRPCMKEVWDCLKEIESKLRKQRTEEAEELDIPTETKASSNTLPFSPYTGKDEQDSTSSTSNVD